MRALKNWPCLWDSWSAPSSAKDLLKCSPSRRAYSAYRGLKGRARFALNGSVPLDVLEPFAAAKIARLGNRRFARPAVLPVVSREAALGANG
jgi:hypothetical protein